MRPLTEEESKTLFTKLANYLGKNLLQLLSSDVEPYIFRLHRDRVYYVSEATMKLATSVARPNLVSLGTCLGKFSKSGKFRLHISSLDLLAKYAKYKVSTYMVVEVQMKWGKPSFGLWELTHVRYFQVWIKPNGEMPFLYGNHVLKAHLGRITEDTPEHQGVVVFSMSDTPLGFGVTARSTETTRKIDPSGIVVFHQA